MIAFKIAKHSSRPVYVVELWEDDAMIATLCPGDVDGEVRLITKHPIRPVIIAGTPIVLNVRIDTAAGD